MYWLDFVRWAGLVEAFAALVVNGHAAFNDDPRKRPVRFMVAVVAGVYVAAYAWLVTDVDQGHWSEHVIGVGLVAWPIAWILPAWWSTVLYRRDERRVRKIVGDDW